MNGERDRRRLTRMIAALILSLASCVEAEKKNVSEHRPEPGPGLVTATVKGIVDGDTIVVRLENGREERVRLLHVKCEEGARPDKKRNTEIGKDAAGMLREWLLGQSYMWLTGMLHHTGLAVRVDPPSPAPEDQAAVEVVTETFEIECPVEVTLEFAKGPRRDGHGRLLAYVHVDEWNLGILHYTATRDVNLNLYIVEQGLSPYFTLYGRSGRYDKRFEAAEKYARDCRLGIWSTEAGTRKYLRLKSRWDRKATRSEKQGVTPVPAYEDERDAESSPGA
jgi:micrococcal nuclease